MMYALMRWLAFTALLLATCAPLDGSSRDIQTTAPAESNQKVASSAPPSSASPSPSPAVAVDYYPGERLVAGDWEYVITNSGRSTTLKWSGSAGGGRLDSRGTWISILLAIKNTSSTAQTAGTGDFELVGLFGQRYAPDASPQLVFLFANEPEYRLLGTSQVIGPGMVLPVAMFFDVDIGFIGKLVPKLASGQGIYLEGTSNRIDDDVCRPSQSPPPITTPMMIGPYVRSSIQRVTDSGGYGLWLLRFEYAREAPLAAIIHAYGEATRSQSGGITSTLTANRFHFAAPGLYPSEASRGALVYLLPCRTLFFTVETVRVNSGSWTLDVGPLTLTSPFADVPMRWALNLLCPSSGVDGDCSAY